MKHSVEELVALARYHYPAPSWDPATEEYDETGGEVEMQRRLAAGMAAGARYGRWRDMHRRIRERLPDCQVHDHSFYLKGPRSCDGCFWAHLDLPILPPEVGTDELVLFVSTIAPYYVIYRRVYILIPGTAPRRPAEHESGNSRVRHAFSFELTAEEEPYARGVAEEVERTFGYEALPPEIGKEVIPEITTPQSALGRTTLYDCLFMGHW